MGKIGLAFHVLAPFRWHLAAVGLAALLGVGMGFVAVSSKPPQIDVADRWSFPRWAPYKAAARQDAAHLLTWMDDPTKKKDAPLKVAGPPWRFIGIVQDGKKNVAVIEVDQGKRVQRIASGEMLPGGEQIIKVGAEELTYAENGEEKTLKLFAVEKPAGPPINPKK